MYSTIQKIRLDVDRFIYIYGDDNDYAARLIALAEQLERFLRENGVYPKIERLWNQRYSLYESKIHAGK